MPWTIKDVDRFKKGLTQEQKRKWVEVANSALQRCLTRGGNQSNCEGSAIRQANGITGQSEIVSFKTKNENYETRTTIHQGKKYIIVPVIMMVEGVHNGSNGPLLFLAEELGRFPDAWNGIPVVINHPQEDGVYISANSPSIAERETVGRVYNAHMDGPKLKAEVWIEESKLLAVSVETLNRIINSENLEVSVGVFNDDEEQTGDWNGETYEGIARNLRPDHLALLPDSVGACSVKDGCGIRTNKSTKGGVNLKPDEKQLNIHDVSKELALQGFVINPILSANVRGYRELVQSAQNTLNGMDNETNVYFLQEIYDATIVYEVRQPNGTKFYRQTYEFVNGNVQLTGEATEVRRNVEFVALQSQNNKIKFNVNRKKGVQTMGKNGDCPSCEKVDALIKSPLTNFTEDDRPWLIAQAEDDESILDKLLPKEQQKPSVHKEEKPVEITKEMILNAMPDEEKAALAYGKKLLAQQRANMIKTIQDYSGKEVWPDEIVTTMDEATLERVFKSVEKAKEKETPEGSYILNGGTFNLTDNNSQEEPLYPTGIEVKSDKK